MALASVLHGAAKNNVSLDAELEAIRSSGCSEGKTVEIVGKYIDPADSFKGEEEYDDIERLIGDIGNGAKMMNISTDSLVTKVNKIVGGRTPAKNWITNWKCPAELVGLKECMCDPENMLEMPSFNFQVSKSMPQARSSGRPAGKDCDSGRDRERTETKGPAKHDPPKDTSKAADVRQLGHDLIRALEEHASKDDERETTRNEPRRKDLADRPRPGPKASSHEAAAAGCSGSKKHDIGSKSRLLDLDNPDDKEEIERRLKEGTLFDHDLVSYDHSAKKPRR